MSTGVPRLVEPSSGLTAADPLEFGAIASRTPWQLFWRNFKKDKLALSGLVFIVLLVIAAIAAPLITKLIGASPPNLINTDALDSFGTATGPSSEHLFGVDQLGRDVLSRTLYGARVSLEVALISTALATLIGVVLGLVAGFFRGGVDYRVHAVVAEIFAHGHGGVRSEILQRGGLARGRREMVAASLVVVGFGVFFALLGTFFTIKIEPGAGVVIFVITLVSWTYIARIVRGQVLSLREKEFVEASRSLGASDARIVFKEILPNLIVPIIVYATLILPTNILLEAALSFLGAGVQPPNASWGAMIAEATSVFDTAWWYMLVPGLALLFTVLAFNVVGDGLSDALNPRQEG